MIGITDDCWYAITLPACIGDEGRKRSCKGRVDCASIKQKPRFMSEKNWHSQHFSIKGYY